MTHRDESPHVCFTFELACQSRRIDDRSHLSRVFGVSDHVLGFTIGGPTKAGNGSHKRAQRQHDRCGV